MVAPANRRAGGWLSYREAQTMIRDSLHLHSFALNDFMKMEFSQEHLRKEDIPKEKVNRVIARNLKGCQT